MTVSREAVDSSDTKQASGVSEIMYMIITGLPTEDVMRGSRGSQTKPLLETLSSSGFAL